MHAQSIASPLTDAVQSWRPAPSITLTTLRTWLDHAIVTHGAFPQSDYAVYTLLDIHGYRPTSRIAWEFASNPLYSIALVRATHISFGQSVKVPILERGFYLEIAGHREGSHGRS